MATNDAALATAAPAPAARRRRSGGGGSQRFADEAAFVLHAWPYKETSLIIDALTRHHGRVALVARGAKRPHSALRGLLQSFQPLTIGWSRAAARAGELGNLTRAEWQGGMAPLRGEALLCGFYLNELILKLLARDDAHEQLFDAYLQALARLAAGLPFAPTLRSFEVVLLREAGYGMQLEHCADGLEIRADGAYRYLPEIGPVVVRNGATDQQVYAGKTLLDIAADDYSDPITLAQGKLLMRHLLQHHLAGQALFTRQMLMDLQNL